MRVKFEGERFVAQCTYAEREDPRGAGFKWDAGRREWFTTSPKVAARLRVYADKNAEKEISRIFLTETPWTGRFTYPADAGSPKEFQRRAARWAIPKNRSYLALRMGLGKTIVANLIRNALSIPTLYVCPPSLVVNVEEEFKKWGTRVDISRYPNFPFLHGDHDFWILPDTMIGREMIQKRVREWADLHHLRGRQTLLFVDEAHRFKNAKTARTKALFGQIFPHFDRAHFLSGTPMPSRPIELYPVLEAAAPETIDFMNQFQYGRKYCAGHHDGFGWDFTGASNVKELATRIIPKFMLRMDKDVLDLPPLTEELLFIGDGMTAKTSDMDRKILALVSPEDLMQGIITAKTNKVELPIATYRRELGLEKVKPALAYLRDLLDESDESVLVFAYHKAVIAELTAGLSQFDPIVITGETPTKIRQDLVKSFNAKESRLFIGNYLAAGVGLNMTAATRVVFVEFSWVPADNDQARDRAHRIGQNDPVLVQYMIFKDSIDRKVMETVFNKRRITQYI